MATCCAWPWAAAGRVSSTSSPTLSEAAEAPQIITPAATRRPRLAAEHDGLPGDIPRINARDRALLAGLPVAAATPLAEPRILGAIPALPADKAPEAAKPGKKGKDAAAPPADGAAARSGAEVARQLTLPGADSTGMFWKLPEITLLERAAESEINDADLMQKARKIEETLATFGVEARVREINSGPAVTQFALEPGEGVRVARIAALADDLALALSAHSVRIEAPVPGKGFVGIEVPNTETSLVALRDVMESANFDKLKGFLRLGLGQDVSGTAIAAKLDSMPHLLIAGTTGSGKSVCVNALIDPFDAVQTERAAHVDD